MKVKKYFDQISDFRSLPHNYQESIIVFFVENRHYMVDPSDVKLFFNLGGVFKVFDKFDELYQFSQSNIIKGVLACKRQWGSLEYFEKFLKRLDELGSDELLVIFLGHAFEKDTDPSQEWYIVVY